jgi:hypothetical protein
MEWAGMDDDNAFAFSAIVEKVQTLVDGGLRVTLDLPETAIDQAALLMHCKRLELALLVVCKTEPISNGKVAAGTKRKSKWQAAEESGMDEDSGDGGQ